jgi:hypothetical protein
MSTRSSLTQSLRELLMGLSMTLSTFLGDRLRRAVSLPLFHSPFFFFILLLLLPMPLLLALFFHHLHSLFKKDSFCCFIFIASFISHQKPFHCIPTFNAFPCDTDSNITSIRTATFLELSASSLLSLFVSGHFWINPYHQRTEWNSQVSY